ncbi:MAG: hypothetical protein ACRC62_14315 [Microcoleus sp.]
MARLWLSNHHFSDRPPPDREYPDRDRPYGEAVSQYKHQYFQVIMLYFCKK